jgi:hypothetical protein
MSWRQMAVTALTPVAARLQQCVAHGIVQYHVRLRFQVGLVEYEVFLHRCREFLEDERNMKNANAVFWDLTPSASCKNRRFGGT